MSGEIQNKLQSNTFFALKYRMVRKFVALGLYVRSVSYNVRKCNPYLAIFFSRGSKFACKAECTYSNQKRNFLLEDYWGLAN